MNAVTGAFGYIGKYIARRLLAPGEPVLTLTGHPDRPNEFGSAIRAVPFRFDSPEAMARSLEGVRVLYNTYWVRFDRGGATYERAIAGNRALLRAALLAGVSRLVHISITNPEPASPLPYFRGKAIVEEEIRRSGIGYAILRPTVVFGDEDILINNIAFLLRKLPVFLIPGSGQYRLQPVWVEDLAALAVEAGRFSENRIFDAVGPEIFTFDALVRLIARAVRSRSLVLHAPSRLALLAARLLGAVLHDVVLTRDEVEGLAANLLVSAAAPTAPTPLTQWLADHSATVGARYASEVRRHYAG